MDSSRVVLITGCSSGFGYRTALLFARKGYVTYASVRDIKSDGAKKLQEFVLKEQLSLHVIEIDVTNDLSVKKGITEILKSENRIDILVNNAGRGYHGAIEEFSIEEIIQQYQINIFGMLRMVQVVAPIMRRNKKGLIINISSINGLIPFPMMGVYSSSKYAIETLTEVLRFELSHFGIKVTQIEPGTFLTEGYSKNVQSSKLSHLRTSPYYDVQHRFMLKMDSARERTLKSKLLVRILDPQRVANLIYTISQKEHPKMRYRIGIDAHLYCFGKRILPERIWEWLLHGVYQW